MPAATRQTTPLKDIDFPIYPSIRPNVDFWIDIFTKYSRSQGVIHDNRNLDIVYQVVRLDASETGRARRKNKRIKKAVTQKYKKILLNLSKGNKTLSTQEKRIAALFGPNTKPSDFKTAANNMRCQTGLKKQFKNGLVRSGAVMDAFKKTFIFHGLPVDLVYLPCVESSYNFKAYSKFGAAGIWQFTHATGRQYMKINYVVDERRDPYISTDAAARLLKRNYAALGEWSMAMTAYNHGLAGMMRAKKSKGSYEKIVKSYTSRSFKFASRNFYSEFLAARIVAKNPDKYFGKIEFHSPLAFQTVKTKGYVSVKELAHGLNIRIRDIQSLNPSLRTPVFKGQKYIPKGFRLKLPETVPPSNIHKQLAGLYHAKQKPSRFHRVQKGDTAGSIARLHYVKLSDLILANGLNRSATIYIGQNLRVPVKDEIILATKKPSPEPPDRLDAHQNKEMLKAATGTKPAEEMETKAKPVVDVTSLNPNIVTSNLAVLQAYQTQNHTVGRIKVEPEETLGHYADWLQIPTQKIRSLNKFKYGSPISIDQEIKIPLGKKTVQEFEEKRYEFHKEIQEDFFESFSVQEVETYVVMAGDTIWNLCLNELEIPFWLLKKYNPDLKFNALHLLQKIKYPIVNKEDKSATKT